MALKGFDPEATAYIKASTPRLMRLAWALTGNQHDAEDLLQESFTIVLAKWSKVRAASSADAYVRQIMVNKHTSRLRLRSSTEVISHDVTVFDRPTAEDTSVDDQQHLLQLLWTLPPKQRTVIVLRYLEDLPDADIAEITGYRVNSVRTLVARALGNLRAAVADESPSDETESGQQTRSARRRLEPARS